MKTLSQYVVFTINKYILKVGFEMRKNIKKYADKNHKKIEYYLEYNPKAYEYGTRYLKNDFEYYGLRGKIKQKKPLKNNEYFIKRFKSRTDIHPYRAKQFAYYMKSLEENIYEKINERNYNYYDFREKIKNEIMDETVFSVNVSDVDINTIIGIINKWRFEYNFDYIEDIKYIDKLKEEYKNIVLDIKNNPSLYISKIYKKYIIKELLKNEKISGTNISISGNIAKVNVDLKSYELENYGYCTSLKEPFNEKECMANILKGWYPRILDYFYNSNVSKFIKKNFNLIVKHINDYDFIKIFFNPIIFKANKNIVTKYAKILEGQVFNKF